VPHRYTDLGYCHGKFAPLESEVESEMVISADLIQVPIIKLPELLLSFLRMMTELNFEGDERCPQIRLPPCKTKSCHESYHNTIHITLDINSLFAYIIEQMLHSAQSSSHITNFSSSHQRWMFWHVRPYRAAGSLPLCACDVKLRRVDCHRIQLLRLC
jgi:hypothetical protein